MTETSTHDLIGSRLVQDHDLVLNPQDLVKACVSLVLARDHLDWYLLMIQRTSHQDDPWSGHYAFPGGKREVGESAYQCAVRECREEVSLSLTQESFLGCSDDFRPHFIPDFAIKPHVFMIEKRVTLHNCPREVASSYWLPVLELTNPDHQKRRVFETSIGVKELDCIAFEDHLIWGISYMILKKLLERLNDLEYLPGKSFKSLV